MKTIEFNLFKIFLIAFLIFRIPTSYCSFPTVEGLFKNGNNKELSGNLIILNLKIAETVDNELLSKIKYSENLDRSEEIVSRKKAATQYLKLIFNVEKDKRTELIQLKYLNEKMAIDSLVQVKYFHNLKKRVRTDKNTERSLIYSLIMMFALNDSTGVSHFLSRHNVDYASNREVMNQDKLALLKKYKRYLSVTKEDPSLISQITSPMNPTEEAEKQKIQELINTNMYQKSNKIKLVERGAGKFFWEVNLENTIALFTNELHRLAQMKVSFLNESINLTCANYMLFDGVHELPKTVIFKALNEVVFKINFLKISHIISKKKSMQTRYKNFTKLKDDNLNAINNYTHKRFTNSDITPELLDPKLFVY